MTSITLSALTATESKAPKKSKLNQLWLDIEKKRKRNQRYQAKLDNFYDYFKSSTESQEHAVCLATEKWINHLLSFMPRKTIKGAHREALYDWIQEELTILESNPFNPVNSRELRDAFSEAILTAAGNEPVPDDIPAEDLEAFLEELEMMVEHEVNLTNEELMEMVREPLKFQAYLHELMAEKMHAQEDDEDDIDWGNDDFFTGSNTYADFDEPYTQETKALYSDKQMTKLYRQLAKQLHPDKVTDAEEKAQRGELMQQLSQAKKDKDVVALLLMAQQYLPDHEMVMDEGMLERLHATLKEKISQLNMEYRELREGGDIKSMIWQRFGGGNKATRERDLERYRYSLEQDVEDLLQKCKEVKTVKQMQVHLKERVDAVRFRSQLMSIDPAELFGSDAEWF